MKLQFARALEWTAATCSILALVVLFGGVSPGCSTAGNRAPVLVAQAGLGVAQSIGQISETATKLQQATVLPAASALRMQEGLLSLNTALAPLPDILRAIDNAQKAGAVDAPNVDKAIAILMAVSGDLTTLLAGVPVAGTTQALIDLVRAAQTTITTVLVEVAKLKG